VVDAGEFAPLYDQQGEIKFEMFLESFRQMQYDALSIGAREMLMQRDTYDAFKKLKAAHVPLATLNIAFQGKRVRTKPLIIRRDGIKIGVVSFFLEEHIPEAAKKYWAIDDPDQTAEAALTYTRKKADIVVAMLHGDMSQVSAFTQKHKGIDIVILSHCLAALQTPVEVNGSLLLCAGSEGKYLGRVDASRTGGSWSFTHELIALDRTIPKDTLLTKTYEEYLVCVSQLAEEIVQQHKDELAAQFPPVAQATDCQSCHTDIYATWAKTPHAHAIESLTEKNEHQNPECIVCHTTYYLKGGFVSLEKTPEYAGIQCAQCHGRMEGHIEFHSGISQKEDAPPTVNQDLCLQCHTPDLDDDFDFERDKKLVH
jgi:2',3'-cyclic-nucleotide 2'-phosphodiesterase (5'-nucleotidase family)